MHWYSAGDWIEVAVASWTAPPRRATSAAVRAVRADEEEEEEAVAKRGAILGSSDRQAGEVERRVERAEREKEERAKPGRRERGGARAERQEAPAPPATRWLLSVRPPPPQIRTGRLMRGRWRSKIGRAPLAPGPGSARCRQKQSVPISGGGVKAK